MPSLLELQNMQHRAQNKEYSPYTITLLFRFHRQGKLDGRQAKYLQKEGLLDDKKQLSFYGKMVLSRLIQNNRKKQEFEKEEGQVPSWRHLKTEDEDTPAKKTK